MRSLRYIFAIPFVFLSYCLPAQVKFSLATNFSVLRNFDGVQKFTVAGQTVIPQWHLDKKTTFYSSFSYYANGKYKGTLLATAKSSSTLPQTFIFTSKSEMKLREISLGIKRYLIGTYDKLEKFNLYGAAGFGLIPGNATNNFLTMVDTSIYSVANNIANGSGDFKRLTFDLTGGVEFPVSYEMYVYSELRAHIPASGYPNNYLLKTTNTPFPLTINLGIRVLFDADP